MRRAEEGGIPDIAGLQQWIRRSGHSLEGGEYQKVGLEEKQTQRTDSIRKTLLLGSALIERKIHPTRRLILAQDADNLV